MNRKYRKTVIAGNWKMNKTPSETKTFMAEFKTIMPKGRWCDVGHPQGIAEAERLLHHAADG